ncbi:MAG: N-6 DNA methylase [Enterocloster sp.]
MGECETPQSVVKLANEILQISNDKTADFCSGIGTFLVSAIERNPESQFYGVELADDRGQRSGRNQNRINFLIG